MQKVLNHIAISILTLCYVLVCLAEPIEVLARVVYPGSQFQRITTAQPTKPLHGTSHIVARRHLPLTKQIELPPHHLLIQAVKSWHDVEFQYPSETSFIPKHENVPTQYRSRPPPSGSIIS